MRIAIDGDVVLYRAAFACQRSHYTVFDDEGYPIQFFRYKRELDTFLEFNDDVGFTWKRGEDVEPLDHARECCKNILQKIERSCTQKFNQTLDLYVYLSGKDNFRTYVSTFKPYKGTRGRSPRHLLGLRDYMIEHWGATYCANLEADDLMSMLSFTNGHKDVAIVTTDKDLNQVPGWHYNFVKDEWDNIPPYKARKFFWKQMITGDTTDNVEGVQGMGPQAAGDLLADIVNEDEQRQRVYKAYLDKYGPSEGHARFDETYTLLKLLETQDQVRELREKVLGGVLLDEENENQSLAHAPSQE